MNGEREEKRAPEEKLPGVSDVGPSSWLAEPQPFTRASSTFFPLPLFLLSHDTGAYYLTSPRAHPTFLTNCLPHPHPLSILNSLTLHPFRCMHVHICAGNEGIVSARSTPHPAAARLSAQSNRNPPATPQNFPKCRPSLPSPCDRMAGRWMVPAHPVGLVPPRPQRRMSPRRIPLLLYPMYGSNFSLGVVGG